MVLPVGPSGTTKDTYRIFFKVTIFQHKLDSGKSIKMKDVLFVPGLKKNLLSTSALDAKGMRVAFINGQVIMWPRGKTIDDVVVIGEQEGGLYKLKGHPE